MLGRGGFPSAFPAGEAPLPRLLLDLAREAVHLLLAALRMPNSVRPLENVGCSSPFI